MSNFIGVLVSISKKIIGLTDKNSHHIYRESGVSEDVMVNVSVSDSVSVSDIVSQSSNVSVTTKVRRARKSNLVLPNIGDRFGKLTVASEAVKNDNTGYRVHCNCDCGKQSNPRVYDLNKGNTKGCGTCYKKEKPPRVKLPRVSNVTKGIYRKEFEGEPLYATYKGMVARCYYPSNDNYKNYGAKGITVCDRWMEPNGQGYLNFKADLGPKPTKYHTLDRFNGKLNYDPGNCGWATPLEQSRNRENTTQIFRGKQVGDFTFIKEMPIFVDRYGQNRRTVLVKCTCGNELVRKLNDLREGRSTRCLCNSGRQRKSDEYDITGLV